ncbi:MULTISPECIES: SCO0607 family lipoprotein [unclassified Streptomyces]|uniref:SCO0607 family lipoprotein n=1 Tax=unclassified Streptomyces TaxID=2593676 RepID=UPI00325094C3
MREPIRPRTASAGNRYGRSVSVLVLTAASMAFALTGCSQEDAICGGGEYPVLNVGSTGSACASKGHEPPKGYTRYPKGKVPEHVGDTWDTYWQSHTVDRSGKIIKAPKG